MVAKRNIPNSGKGSPLDGEPTPKTDETIRDNEREVEQAEVDPVMSVEEMDEAALDELIAEVSTEEEPDDLTKALLEAEELRDRYLRLKAEWDNFRKRTEAERVEERSRATQRLVEKLLPIIDDLERAIDHSDTASEESLKEGIVQVYSKMQTALASDGVKVIDPKGEPFDANLHSAIQKVKDSDVPEETVLEVYQKGYEMGNRVLRPAMVVVSHH